MTTNDRLDTLALEDQFGYWGEHPEHLVCYWQVEVSEYETRLGYWSWVEEKLQALPPNT